ncbi:hypothetical protein RB653_008099 [Dictyostelium firmibasis]|uniref:Uncharacterized protein n=1 Tax=Dictyostelium firmibasis TaxID=79012 RepID=A0AAN7TZ73_9MYCE
MSNKLEINKNDSKDEIKFNLNLNEGDEIKELYKIIESLKKEVKEKDDANLILQEKLEQETEINKILKLEIFKKKKEFEMLATQIGILKSKYGNKKCDIEVIIISSDDEDDEDEENKYQDTSDITSNTTTTTTTNDTNTKDEEVVFCKPYNYDADDNDVNSGENDLGYNETDNSSGECNHSYVVKKEM